MAKYNGNAVVKGCRDYYSATTTDSGTSYAVAVSIAELDWDYLPSGGIGSDSQSSGRLVRSATGKSSTTRTASGTDATGLSIEDKTYTWSKKSTAQQVTVAAAYTFTKCLDSNDSRFTGTSTASHTFTVPALDPAQYSYSVTLDSNGGSAVTSPLTKWYGESLALPQPVRTGCVFAGWAASSAPTTVVYQPGAAYTANEAASLVAVWTPVITSATITQLYAARDDGRFLWDSQTGKHTSASDDGEYVYIRAWWRVEGADAATISLGASMDSTPAWTGTAQQTSKPGTGELYIEGVAEWGTSQTASASGQYDVTVTLSTGAGNPSDSRGTTVPTAFFTIDVLAGGHGIAFGKPATQAGVMDIGFDVNCDADVGIGGTTTMTNPSVAQKADVRTNESGNLTARLYDSNGAFNKAIFFSQSGNLGQQTYLNDSWSSASYYPLSPSTALIQHGTKSLGSCAANAYTDIGVTFDVAYSSAPHVVACLHTTSTAATIGSITLAVTSEDANGFTLRVFNNTSSSRSPNCHWIAIGTP